MLDRIINIKGNLCWYFSEKFDEFDTDENGCDEVHLYQPRGDSAQGLRNVHSL